MPDDIQNVGGNAQLPPKPVVPDGHALYNSIMGKIEPDLILSELEKMDEKYKGETPEEKKARMKRYKEAFTKYEEIYGEYIGSLTEEVNVYKREALDYVESQNQVKEEKILADLESSILEA